MKKTTALMIGLAVALCAAVGGVVYLVFFRRSIVANKLSTDKQLPRAGECSPDTITTGVNQAIAAGQQGSQAGGYGAAAGALSGLAPLLAGPCGAAIEKKLRDMVKRGLKDAAKGLDALDRARRKAQGLAWDYGTAGPIRREVAKAVGKATEGTKNAVNSVTKKVGVKF